MWGFKARHCPYYGAGIDFIFFELCSKIEKVMEKSFAQLIPTNWLPTKNWEEFSRMASENQITFQLGHLNPEINMAP